MRRARHLTRHLTTLFAMLLLVAILRDEAENPHVEHHRLYLATYGDFCNSLHYHNDDEWTELIYG